MSIIVGTPEGYVNPKPEWKIYEESIITCTDQIIPYKNIPIRRFKDCPVLRRFSMDDCIEFDPNHPERAIGVFNKIERRFLQRFNNHGNYKYIGRKYSRRNKYRKKVNK